MKACSWGNHFFFNLELENLTRHFHPAMNLRDCLWLTERWNTQSRRHGRKHFWYAACISVFANRGFLNSKRVSKCCAVKVSTSCVRNVPILERTKILLGFSQTPKGFFTTVIVSGEVLAFWSGTAACAALLFTCLVCPSLVPVWQSSGEGQNVEFETHIKSSGSSGDQVKQKIVWTFLGCPPAIFRLLVVGISATLCSFNTASLSHLPKLPCDLPIFSLPQPYNTGIKAI